MSYEVYKLLHVLGILLLFVALGGVTLHAWNGGTREGNRGRKAVATMHGFGLLLIILAGFGMIARRGYMEGGLPGWVWGKFLVWLVAGGIFYLPYRRPESATHIFWLLPLLGVVAGSFAVFKPF